MISKKDINMEWSTIYTLRIILLITAIITGFLAYSQFIHQHNLLWGTIFSLVGFISLVVGLFGKMWLRGEK